MDFETKLKAVQLSLEEQEIDGWLLYDYHYSNPLAWSFLEISLDKMATRRFFYWIPKKGKAVKIVPLIEPYTLDHLPGLKWHYKGWQELERFLFSIAVETKKIAMEYSPYNALPSVSKVDAGTVELIRKAGIEVVSSANILQQYTSVWTSGQWQSHVEAATVLENIVDRTWAFIEHSLQSNKPLDEYQVQQFMLKSMHQAECETADWPICAVNVHSADPHYQPRSGQSLPIFKGDFILLDLWCKKRTSHAVYADITRVGVAASQPSPRQDEIFHIVRKARDLATAMVKEHYENRRPLLGWQVDQLCRDFIQKVGFGDYFIHRTGHNIGVEVHGPGANLDNLETHDFRQLLAGTCFSIEPGIYLPKEFGVRLEYDIYLDPAGVMRITGGIQEEIACLNI
jgi:Xaa-Pro dipeptidase